MATRDDVIAAARSWLGVRWRHQGRTRARGVDCFGLLWCVARDIGVPIADETGYARVPDGFSFEAGMRARFDPLPIPAAGPGDILVFTEARYPCHTAILVPGVDSGGPRIIHAHARRRCVLAEPLAQEWGARICFAFAFRGLD